MGVLAGLLGCVFGVLGILTWGIIFVPLAALCSIVGLFRGIVGGSAAGIATSLLAGVLTAIGFVTSPSLWLLTAGLIGASLPDRPSAPSHKAETTAKPAPGESPPSSRIKGSDQLTDAQLFYEYGHTAQVEKRYQDALEWYRKAADLGSDRAQYGLGLLYEKGQGVQQSLDEAIKWYRLAGNQGSIEAQDKLSLLNTSSPPIQHDQLEQPLPAEKQIDNTAQESGKNGISPTTAEPSKSPAPVEANLSLKCTPDTAPLVESKDPIVSVVITIRGRDWRVTHIAASGARYERNAQYLVHDVGNYAWEGENEKRQHLKMVGQIFTAGSGTKKYIYIEKIYDANSGGAQTYEGRSLCAVSSQESIESDNDPQPSQEQVIEYKEIDFGAKCDESAANPNDPRKPRSIVGVTYDALKANPKGALEACRTALSKFPKESRYKYQFARALDINEPEKAIPIYKELIHENYPAAYDNLGSIYLRKQNISAAISVLKSGVRANDPDSMVTLANLIERGYLPVDNQAAAVSALLGRAAQLGHSGAQRSFERKRLNLENEQRKRAYEQQEQQMMLNIFGTILRGVGR